VVAVVVWRPIDQRIKTFFECNILSCQALLGDGRVHQEREGGMSLEQRPWREDVVQGVAEREWKRHLKRGRAHAALCTDRLLGVFDLEGPRGPGESQVEG